MRIILYSLILSGILTGCKETKTEKTVYESEKLLINRISEYEGISSYAYNKTIQIAKEKGLSVPQYGFDKSLELKVGSKKVHIGFFGEGHTCDNVVGYFPLEGIMFGGCLIKEIS